MQERHMSFMHTLHIVCQENFAWKYWVGPPQTHRGTRPVDIPDRKTKRQPPLNTKGILSHD